MSENELQQLKDQATSMGLNFHPNIGIETLRTKLQEFKKMSQEEQQQEQQPQVEQKIAEPVLTPEQRRSLLRSKQRKEQLRLVRVRIQNFNPAKKDLQGEILCVSNELIGDVKKYIPYQGEGAEAWHVPYALYRHLQERVFTETKMVKGANNTRYPVRRQVKEFQVTLLPQLTPEEIADLKKAQMAAGL